MILPGISFIPNFMNIADNPVVKHRLDAGLIAILDKPKDLVKKNIQKISDFDHKTLAKDIPKIYDIKLLDEIKATDARASVQKAVQKQIDLLRDGPPREQAPKVTMQ